MPLTTKKDGVATAPKKEEVAEKTKAVVNAETEITEEAANVEVGNLSKNLSFVAALGDPSRDDVTPVTKDGKTFKKVDPTIVGYRFVADIDLEVPDCPPGDDLKSNLMSFTGDPYKTRTVKAGVPFDLTKFETGMLISRPEFNGKALGGEKPVTCAYTNTARKSSDGKIAKTSAATAVPSITIRGLSGSIKDYEMIHVLSFTKEKGENGRVKITRTINKGFEKWSALCKEVVRKRSTSASTASAVNKRNKGAAAFLQIAGAKKAN